MSDLEILKKQLEEALSQVNNSLNAYNPPPFEIVVITASEGKIFRRKSDGLIFGKEISLGYDYSQGFKRRDSIDFYEEITEPTQE